MIRNDSDFECLSSYDGCFFTANLGLSGTIPSEIEPLGLYTLKLGMYPLSLEGNHLYMNNDGHSFQPISSFSITDTTEDHNALTGSVASLFQTDDSCRFNPHWSDSFDYRGCFCDLCKLCEAFLSPHLTLYLCLLTMPHVPSPAQNSFSNIVNGISVGCKL